MPSVKNVNREDTYICTAVALFFILHHISGFSGRDEHCSELSKAGNHACDKCGKTFSRRWDLNRHRVVHTGERPYQCKLCWKRFNQKSNLRCHMATHLVQQ